MKKMLYIMHIDWNWIKQRPHWLVEELNKYYDITVAYLYAYNRNNLTMVDKPKGVKVIPLYRIPNRLVKYNFAKILNNMILKLQINTIKDEFDYIWLTSPATYKLIRDKFKNSKIIYDCMDDNVGIKDPVHRKEILEEEKLLLQNANIVFVSSINLYNKLVERGRSSNIYLINNGIPSKLLEHKDYKSREFIFEKKDMLKLLYVGTISYWFDFEMIINLLNEYENINVTLMGPKEVEIPHHDRLVYIPPKPHEELVSIVQQYDVLIIPFKLEELILSVDPVKAYEYISFGKNILSVYYPELEKFKDFFHFYTTYEDLKFQIEKLLKNNKVTYSEIEAKDFLLNNTWSKRAESIHQILENVNE